MMSCHESDYGPPQARARDYSSPDLAVDDFQEHHGHAMARSSLQGSVAQHTLPEYAAGNYPDSYASRLRERKFK